MQSLLFTGGPSRNAGTVNVTMHCLLINAYPSTVDSCYLKMPGTRIISLKYQEFEKKKRAEM